MAADDRYVAQALREMMFDPMARPRLPALFRTLAEGADNPKGARAELNLLQLRTLIKDLALAPEAKRDLEAILLRASVM